MPQIYSYNFLERNTGDQSLPMKTSEVRPK